MSDAKNNDADPVVASLARDGAVLGIISAFANDLITLQSNEQVAWYVAREVVGKLGFADCVVYFLDDEKTRLRQQAAFGEKKNPVGNEIVNVLEITLGEGVTGQVAKSGKPLIVDDLDKFSDYIVDVEPARSEICVPIMVNDRVFGVIDCEDRRVGHFNESHLEILSTVATIMSLRLSLIKQDETAGLIKKLAHSEERFRDITEATSDWYWEMGPDLRYSYVSPRFYEDSGVAPEDFIGKERIDFVSPEFIEQNPDAWQAHLDDMGNQRPFQNFEYFGDMKVTGARRYVRVSAKPFFGENGRFLGYRGSAISITDRKKAERALLAGEKRFRDFAESSSDWFWEMGSDLRFTFVTEGIREKVGVDPESFVGKSRRDFVVEDEDSEKWQAHLEDLENHLPFRNFQYQAHNLDGDIVYVSTSGKPIFDENGKFMGYRGTGTNITAHVEADRLSLALKDAIDSIPDMMALFDADDRVVFYNKKYIETLSDLKDILVPGTSFEEIARIAVERGTVMNIKGDPEQWIRDRIAKFQKSCDPELHQQRDGRWVLTYDHKLDDGGTFMHRVDVTDLIATQELLEHAKEEAELANRTKSEFLANMSHELRTPLNAIIGFSDSIRQEIFGPLNNETYKGYLDDIHGSGQHLLELISDILNVSAIEAGKLELHEENLIVEKLINGTLPLVKGRADEGEIQLTSTIDDNLPLLRADKRRLVQIFLNLLSNAVKFTLPGGSVEITASLDKANAYIFTVTDTGIGMDDEEMTTAMSQFGQVHFDVSQKKEGAGLGLPLTRGLTELHGGTLKIESEKGKGSTVIVRFPPERTIP